MQAEAGCVAEGEVASAVAEVKATGNPKNPTPRLTPELSRAESGAVLG